MLVYDAYARDSRIGGGSSISLLAMMREIQAENRFDLNIILSDTTSSYCKEYQKMGVRIFSNHLVENLGIYGREQKLIAKIIKFSSYAVFANIWFFALCLREKIDVIVFNEPRAAATFILTARLYTQRILLFLRSSFELDSPWMSLLFSSSKHIACVSQGVKNALSPKYQKKASVVHNIFYPRLDQFIDREFTGDLRLISVGGISPYKGFEVALEAISILEADLQQRLRYSIVGGVKNKEYFHRLQDIVKKNSLGHIVSFTGYQQDIYPLLHNADVMIIPSHHEGFGRVVLEAYDANLPVLGSNVGGIPEIIENGVTGLLFEAGDAGDLVNKLRLILENPELCKKFSKNTTKKLEQYTHNNCTTQIMNMIESI